LSIEIEHQKSPNDDVRLLIGELDTELNANYSPEQRHGFDIARLFKPYVAFFIARLDGQPAGCGGIAFDDGIAEVKRMYVRPQARGKSVAQTILSRLEQEAGAKGVRRVHIETGDAQKAAMRFYERAGFTRCSAFGAYKSMSPPEIERSVFFEKEIG
jgi:putative acetyltransferase